MTIKDIKKMKIEDLREQEVKQREEYIKVRDAMRLGKEKDVKKSLKIKRNLARILTVIKEKEISSN